MDIKTLPTVEIKYCKKSGGLSQIYSTGLQYCMYNEKGEQINQWVLCKDYLNEQIASQINEKSYSIYGFTADPNVDPKIDWDNTRILLNNSKDKNFLSKIGNVLDFVNQIEDHMNLRKTTAEIVSNPEKKYEASGVFGVVSSARWMRSPTMMSLYALLLRVGFVHTIGNDWKDTYRGVMNGTIPAYQSNDRSYLTTGREGFEKILNVGYKEIFYVQPKLNYPAKKDVGTLHNSSGICAFSRGTTKTFVKGWHKPEIDEKLNSMPKESKISLA